MERSSSSLTAGVVVIRGPEDKTQRMLISAADSPDAIEHCIRNLFEIEEGFSLLLYNDDGIAMPMGVGLLMQPGAKGPESTCPVFKLELRKTKKHTATASKSALNVESVESCQAESVPIAPEPSKSVSSCSIATESPAPSRNQSLLSTRFAEEIAPKKQAKPVPEWSRASRQTVNLGGARPSRQTIVVSKQKTTSLGPGDNRWVDPEMDETLEDIEDKDEADQVHIRQSCSNTLFDSVMPLLTDSVFDSTPLGRDSSMVHPGFNNTFEQAHRPRDEVHFWCECAEGYRRDLDARRTSTVSQSHSARRSSCYSAHGHEELHGGHVAAFDSTDARIHTLYNQWKGSAAVLSIEEFQKHLRMETKLNIDWETLEIALGKVYRGLNPGMCSEEIWKRAQDGTVPRNIFGGVWQRLMLGALCARCRNEHGNVVIEEPELQLTEYNEDAYDAEIITEEELLFRQPLRTRGRRNMDGEQDPLDCPARWLRADSASADRLLRMGVKFFVHPMATDDAITTARTGMTKIDRYRHQYFVSLEVYSMNPELKITSELSARTRSLDSIEDLEPPVVGPNVTRSSMFLVATGSPSSGHRDWLLSFVGKPVAGIKDPLDFFSNSTEAATNVLNLIKQDLESHGRMREYQSDFLLYTILDRSAHELGPICWAYGHRLRWMQNCLDKQKLRMPTEYLDEVSKMRLEMQELKQWVGQMKGILKTLAEDCRNIRKDGESIPWNFGAHAEGRGKSLLMFLSNTDATLEQTSDRLATLNDLARNFLDSHARLRDGFTNNILLALTISTAIYAPAQLLAGIYGTNFVNDEGTPTVPELTWKYGYPVFITACLGMIIAGFVLAWYCLRTNARG